MAIHQLTVKRVYMKPSEEDGLRILVERLWPRGLSKEKAAVDVWLKDIAPSTDLRKWFNHDPDKWHEFQNRYEEELQQNKDLVNMLRKKIQEQKVTLLFSSREEHFNDAIALQQYLKKS